MSFTPAGGGGWTKFVRGALDAAETVGELIDVAKSALRLANGEGDLDDLVTLGITGAGLGAGGLPPGKGNSNLGHPDVYPSTPVGRRGSPLTNTPMNPPRVPRNSDSMINGRRFTGHALDEMQNRGIPPSVVEDAINNGIKSPDPIPGRQRSFSPENRVTVITEGTDVITVIPGRQR